MAITVLATGAVNSGTGAITPPFGTGWQQDDVMLGIGETNGNSAFTVPTGWAHVLGSPVNVDTSTRLTALWRRFQAGDTALSWGTPSPSNHGIAQLIAFRGVKATGDPWNVAPTTAQDTAANATATWPAATSSAADCCFVLCIATGRDIASTANLGTVTAANLSSITERMDNWVIAGAGGGIGMTTGFRTTAGALGTATATMGSTDAKALMTIVLEPAAAPAAPPSLVMAPRL